MAQLDTVEAIYEAALIAIKKLKPEHVDMAPDIARAALKAALELAADDE